MKRTAASRIRAHFLTALTFTFALIAALLFIMPTILTITNSFMTESEITANGALDSNAQKIFRGTIDFQRGSKGSHGSETENVLLLSDDIINRTLPVILCSEEDVNGTHGATIGDISGETLMYFQSRGISKEQAARLLKASVADSFLHLVNDSDTTKLIGAETGDRYE